MYSPESQAARYAIYGHSTRKITFKDSIQYQKSECCAAAFNLNPRLTLSEGCVFNDEGVSHWSQRPGVAALLKSAQQEPPPFGHLFVVDTTRFSRNVADVFDLVNLLAREGVVVHFVRQRLRSDEPDFNTLAAMLGKDHLDLLRERYSDLQGVITEEDCSTRASKDVPLHTHAAAVAAHHIFPEMAAGEAALASGSGGRAVGAGK